MLKSFSEYQRRGSGWRLRRVTQLEIHIGEFQPLRGKKHEPLPKSLTSKKAIINMKNDDDECFKWAVTSALNPTDTHPERISGKLKEKSKEMNWEGIPFPTPLSDIRKFEENNNTGVNVFSADESLKVYPLQIYIRENRSNKTLSMEEPLQCHQRHVETRKLTDQKGRTQKIHL
jgi:hypothetical protein